jgi:hypothetical protein
MLAVSVVLLGSCGDNSTDPAPFGDITGYYISTSFTITPTDGSPRNVLLAGGLLRLGLEEDGSTSGELEIPAGIAGAEPVNESMAGTAIRTTETTMGLDQPADTFVRDIVWLVSGTGTLTGSYSGADGTVEVTLTIKQPD